jgi:arsenate reductase-like glutaredoxin family protein
LASAGSIFVDLLLNDAQFKDALKKAGAGASDFSGVVAKSAKAAAFSVAALGGALSALTVHQLHVIDATSKTARSLGISTKSFQALSLVADEAGVDQEKLASLIGKSQKSIAEAAAGGSNAFRGLGIDVNKLVAMKPDKQFEAIAEKLSLIENPTIRNAKAMEIFGKSGRDVVDMLSDFKEKAADARAFNDKFNISVSDLDAQKIEQANDAFGRIGKAASGVGNTIAVALSPVIRQLSIDFIDGTAGAEVWAKFITGAVDAVVSAMDLAVEKIAPAANVFNNVITSMGGVGAAIVARAQGDKLLASQILGETDDMINQNNKKTDEFLKKRQTFTSWLEKARKDADAAAAKALQRKGGLTADDVLGPERMEKALERQKKLLKDIVGPGLELKQTLADLGQLYHDHAITASQYADAIDKINLQMAELDKTASGGFKAGMLKVKKEFSDVGDLAEKTVVDSFKNAEDALVQFAMTGKLSLKGMVDSMLADITRLAIRQSITGPLFSAISGATATSGGGIGSFLGSLFSGFHADGGFIGPGQWGIAGEAGAEAIFGGKTGVTVVPQMSGGSNPIYMSFNISTPDANSFRQSQSQIMQTAQNAMARATKRNG